jgi:3-oxoacyl-[acyl-carrier-protein] synthase-3
MVPLHRDVAILGTGRALPARRIPNAELAKLVSNYDAASGDFSVWVDRVTHIQERWWVEPGRENAGSLGMAASRHALEQAGLRGSEIDQVVFCSFTYDEIFPGEHALIARDLGTNCGTFVMTAACAGSVYGLTIARSLVQSGQCRNVLVVGSECMSRVTDLTDPMTAILFGDAAGAMVVGRKADGEDTGFLGTSVLRNEYHPTAIWMKNANCPVPGVLTGPDRRQQNREWLHMEGGPRVLRNAVNRMADAVVECLGFTPDDLRDGKPELRALLQRAKIVPHQANGRIVDGLQEKLGCPRENVYRTVYFAGNSSEATNAFTLDYAIREGNLDRQEPAEGSGRMGTIVRSDRRIAKGDLVVMVSIGAGYVYGAVAFVHGY